MVTRWMQAMSLEDTLGEVEVGVGVVALPHPFERKGEDLGRQACARHGVVLRELSEPEAGAHFSEHLTRCDIEVQRVRAGLMGIEEQETVR